METAPVAMLATALFKRGHRNQVIQDVRPLSRKSRIMVSLAFTLLYMPAREDCNRLVQLHNPELPPRKAIETCREWHVLVMEFRKK